MRGIFAGILSFVFVISLIGCNSADSKNSDSEPNYVDGNDSSAVFSGVEAIGNWNLYDANLDGSPESTREDFFYLYDDGTCAYDNKYYDNCNWFIQNGELYIKKFGDGSILGYIEEAHIIKPLSVYNADTETIKVEHFYDWGHSMDFDGLPSLGMKYLSTN